MGEYVVKGWHDSHLQLRDRGPQLLALAVGPCQLCLEHCDALQRLLQGGRAGRQHIARVQVML